MFDITNYQGNVSQNHENLTPVRMTIIKKKRDNKCWQGCEERETEQALLVGI